MSVVTNVVIHYDNLEANELPDLIAAVFDDGHGIKSITDGGARAFWGGGKNPECHLLAGAFNYLDLEAMLAGLAALPWEYPRAAQVWVKEQWDTRFQLWAHDGTTFRLVVDGRPDLPVSQIPTTNPSEDASASRPQTAGPAGTPDGLPDIRTPPSR